MNITQAVRQGLGRDLGLALIGLLFGFTVAALADPGVVSAEPSAPVVAVAHTAAHS
jgi:hypothetical protein